MTLTVRRAAAAEVADVRHRVLRPGRPRETAVFDGDERPDARHWVIDRDGVVVGVVSVLPATMPDPPKHLDRVPPALQLRGMAVVDEERGRGVGALLLEAVHRQVGRPMWCNARAEIVRFYERHGWHATDVAFDVPLVGRHRRMWRTGDADPQK